MRIHKEKKLLNLQIQKTLQYLKGKKVPMLAFEENYYELLESGNATMQYLQEAIGLIFTLKPAIPHTQE